MTSLVLCVTSPPLVGVIPELKLSGRIVICCCGVAMAPEPDPAPRAPMVPPAEDGAYGEREEDSGVQSVEEGVWKALPPSLSDASMSLSGDPGEPPAAIGGIATLRSTASWIM